MRGISLFCALTLIVVGSTLGQQGTSDLRGLVVDQQGAVLPGVTIIARNQDTGLFRQTISSEDGTYFFSGMTPGRYQVGGELPGFKKYQRGDIRLEVGKTAAIDIVLEVGNVTDEIVVTAEAPIIDTSSKEIGGYIQSREMVDLPSVNRNFTGFLALMPGVVPLISTNSFGADSVNVNGQGIQNTNYALDGAANNDSFNAGNGGAQARVPIESVQEFQFLTSQFDAEFGGSSGGIVNAVSKQGTNQFHGSAFGFFKDSAFTAKDHFVKTQNLQKPNTSEQQYGGTLGGPIVRDKAHFFFSLERVFQDQGVTINIPARPEFNSPEFERTRVWNTLVRFDHQINAANTWSVRWLRETSPQFNQSAANQTKAASEEESDLDYTIVANLTSVLSARTLNTFRAFTTLEDVLFGNTQFFDNGRRQELLLTRLEFLGFNHQQSARADRRLDRALGADETFAWFLPDRRGSHDLKVGVQYNWTGLRIQNWGNLNGTFRFGGTQDFNPDDPRTYPEQMTIRVPGPLNFLVKDHVFSWFAQDKWKLSSRATLSAGLRHELEIVPIFEADNPLFPNPRKYPVDKNNYAPRLGISYAMDRTGHSVLRLGYGLFYQRTPLTFLNPIVSNGVFADSFIATFPPNNRDAGPSQGRLPTEPFLVNGPTVNRTLLSSMFPPGTRQRNVGNVRFDNPDRRLAKSRQFSVGFERQLWRDTAISADYIHSANRDQLMLRDLNPGLRVDTSRTGRVNRINPNFVSAVLQSVNVGWIDYDSLQLQFDKRFSRNYTVRLAYTLSKGFGNTQQGQNDQIDTQLLDDLRLNLNEGPTTIDRRHNLVMSGTVNVPHTGGLRLSSVVRALSGSPFSIIDDSTDPDRNGITGDDWLPAGRYSGNGGDAITVDYRGGRNGAVGPGFFQFDLRGGYRFRLGEQKTLETFAEVFNLTNKSNFANPTVNNIANRRNQNFLIVTALRGNGPTRTTQFGVRFAF
jgi:hypothetical protein